MKSIGGENMIEGKCINCPFKNSLDHRCDRLMKDFSNINYCDRGMIRPGIYNHFKNSLYLVKGTNMDLKPGDAPFKWSGWCMLTDKAKNATTGNGKDYHIYVRNYKGRLVYTVLLDGHRITTDVVIYQALYGDLNWYIREFNDFISPVDRVKYPKIRYPQIKQDQRFEKILIKKVDL